MTDKCIKTVDYGRDFYIRKLDDCLRYHSNIGLCLKLPAGLDKLKKPIHNIDDIFKKLKLKHKCSEKFDFDSNLDRFEDEYNVAFEVWAKTRINSCKNEIKCIRKSGKKSQKIQLHLDTFSRKLFLICDKKLYFRSYLKQLNAQCS